MMILTIGSIGLGLAYLLFTSMDNANWKLLFKNCNLYKDEMYPKFKEKKTTPYGYFLRFSLPLGLSSEDFIRKQEAIEQYLGKRVEIKYKHKNILIEVYEKDLEKVYPYDDSIETKFLEIPLGYTHGGKLITLNLKKAIHILIAGETGGGKSSVSRLILTYLTIKTNIIVHLIDLKGGVEGNLFRRYVKTFVRDLQSAETLIYKVKAEVERRYNLLFEADCLDIDEYNRKHKDKPLHREVLVIDEYSVLSNSRDTKDLITVIEELGALARACGVHLILSTQRPDAKILSPRIKANLPTTIGLKTKNDVNSRIIGIEGLEKLRGNGHAILQHEGKDTELQVMFIDSDQTRELLREKYKDIKDNVIPFIPKTNEEIKSFDNLDLFEE